MAEEARPVVQIAQVDQQPQDPLQVNTTPRRSRTPEDVEGSESTAATSVHECTSELGERVLPEVDWENEHSSSVFDIYAGLKLERHK